VAYAVDFSDTAKAQLLAIPLDAAMAVADVLAGMSLDPWNYGRAPVEPPDRSKAHRCVAFGAGFVWCLVLDRDALVWVTEVQWLG